MLSQVNSGAAVGTGCAEWHVHFGTLGGVKCLTARAMISTSRESPGRTMVSGTMAATGKHAVMGSVTPNRNPGLAIPSLAGILGALLAGSREPGRPEVPDELCFTVPPSSRVNHETIG